MNVYEMEGFLRGKCMPRDILVNESTAAYLVRKLNESATLKADRDAQQKRADALAAENGNQRAWINKCSELWDAGCELDDFLGLIPETPATSAALAAIRSQAVDEFADSQIQKSLEHRAIGNSGLADVYNDNAMDAKVFAMRLREAAELREAK